jgi:hypothetical protein
VIVAVPAATAVTTPVVPSTVAIEVLPDVHVPPTVVLDSVAVEPAQATAVPEIAAGAVTTVTVAVRVQPVLVTVYVSAEVPADTPDTIPFTEPTVATDVVPLAHVHVLPTEVSVVAVPIQAIW